MSYKQTIGALEKNGYKVSFFNSKEEATAYLVDKIKNLKVGFGDSATLCDMGLAKQLAVKNIIVDPSSCTSSEFINIATQALTTDVFITSVNGVSQTGELVNIDGTGNRVAASLFGHRKIFFVFGTNKIEDDLEKAIWRARNIAAPMNAKRLGYKTPCAIKGDKCYDCSSPDRICNTLNIYLKKMNNVEAEIIMIDESLGY